MEVFEFILIVLACVIVSSVAGRFTRHVALPLVQVLVGFLVALVAPAVVNFQVSSELFLVLFIAPLLFDEARRSNKRQLWENKGSILSLAVGLVFATVLCLGFALNLMVPSIPLAAALACAAALGPTDAAAVSALGQRVSMRPRQSVLLSGESLVNDASGVVSFQFALAAAVTGSFSLADAGEEFAVLFFGGILVGAALGALALVTMRVLRAFGYEDTTIHVLYEVFTPFVVFLTADWLGVSGILAVVAAGLVMAERVPRLISIDAAKRQMVSDNFWKIIVFLINGIIFVMLGMQLPLALAPAVAERFSLLMLVAIVVALTVLMMACRFLWLTVMEFLHVDPVTGKRGVHQVKGSLKDALIMTLAGPKGAVSLSIIFTIPITVASGGAFPDRGLIIFLAAGVILATLLAANFLLPLVTPKRTGTDEQELHQATISILESTIAELQRRLQEGKPEEYVPALRLTLARYQTRLARQRESATLCGNAMTELSRECLRVQQARADELQGSEDNKLSLSEEIPYYSDVRSIRASVGYVGSAVNVGARFHNVLGKARLLWQRTRPLEVDSAESARIYYDSCLFAIELEHAALDYLRAVPEEDTCRRHAADVLTSMHEAALRSIAGQINYGQETKQDTGALRFDGGPHEHLPEGMRPTFSEQITKARRYANAVDANALIIELDAIRHLEEAGDVSNAVARQLRQHVYALQQGIEGADQ